MIEQEYTVEGTPTIEVRVPSGRVDVRKGAPGRVRVKVDTKDPDFLVEQRGDTVIAASDNRNNWSSNRAHVLIETPEGSDLSISTASARIQCEVAVSKATIKTASGDIDVTEADTLTVKTASGDLDVGVVGRALRMSSASGDLRVRDAASGTVVASTASGDVHLGDTDAILEAHTVSGNIYVSQFLGSQADFKTMSGNVHVAVPASTKIDLDVRLISGRLRLPESRPSDGQPEREMSIRAKTVSGDFNLHRA